jgi:malonyl CoA-acyl carrier protein transacylase
MDEAESAMKQFMHAQAGVKNAQMAISTALAELPMLDPQKVYVAGHSSAATARSC